MIATRGAVWLLIAAGLVACGGAQSQASAASVNSPGELRSEGEPPQGADSAEVSSTESLCGNGQLLRCAEEIAVRKWTGTPNEIWLELARNWAYSAEPLHAMDLLERHAGAEAARDALPDLVWATAYKGGDPAPLRSRVDAAVAYWVSERASSLAGQELRELGSAYAALGEPRKAQSFPKGTWKDYEWASFYQTTWTETEQSTAFFTAATAALGRGEFKQANAFMDQGIATAQSLSAIMARSLLLTRLGKQFVEAGALEEARAMCSIRVKDWDCRAVLGALVDALIQSGKRNEASRVLEDGIRNLMPQLVAPGTSERELRSPWEQTFFDQYLVLQGAGKALSIVDTLDPERRPAYLGAVGCWYAAKNDERAEPIFARANTGMKSMALRAQVSLLRGRARQCLELGARPQALEFLEQAAQHLQRVEAGRGREVELRRLMEVYAEFGIPTPQHILETVSAEAQATTGRSMALRASEASYFEDALRLLQRVEPDTLRLITLAEIGHSQHQQKHTLTGAELRALHVVVESF